jgi:hypothetical protein
MDRWTAFVATAHLRLRLDIFYRRVLQGYAMPEIKRPMELAGLKSRLLRAKLTEAAIADTGKRFDEVLNKIDELHASAKSHAGTLEQYEGELARTIAGMIGGSNGGDPLDGSDGQDSNGIRTAQAPATDPVKPVAAVKDETAAARDATVVIAADVAPMPAEVLAEPLASWTAGAGQ